MIQFINQLSKRCKTKNDNVFFQNFGLTFFDRQMPRPIHWSLTSKIEDQILPMEHPKRHLAIICNLTFVHYFTWLLDLKFARKKAFFSAKVIFESKRGQIFLLFDTSRVHFLYFLGWNIQLVEIRIFIEYLFFFVCRRPKTWWFQLIWSSSATATWASTFCFFVFYNLLGIKSSTGCSN